MEDIHEQISDDDLTAAFREAKTYRDISADELKKLYAIAYRHAKTRVVSRIRACDIMSRDVIAVQEHDDISHVVRMLSEFAVSGLPVVGKDACVIGFVSEADILSRLGMRRGHTFRDILRHLLGQPLPEPKVGGLVGDIMTTPPLTTNPDADICQVSEIMDEKRIKRLPVVDQQNRLLGIVSRGDIVRAMCTK